MFREFSIITPMQLAPYTGFTDDEVKIDIRTYQNDMTSFHGKDDVFALLVHLGYLRYNSNTKEVSIPNKEILDEFRISTKSEEYNDSVQ